MSNAVLESCETGHRGAWRWVSWGVVGTYWLGMFAGTHWPSLPHPNFGYIDKWMHFSAYLGLGLLFTIATSVRRPITLAVVMTTVLLLAGYGALDELTQPLVGRDCDVLDWCADLTGILFGIGCFQLGALVWRRYRAGERENS